MITSAVATSIHAVSPESTFACAMRVVIVLRPHGCHGAVVDLAGAYSNGPHERHHEDLAVAHLARATALADRVDGRLHEVLRHGDLDTNLVREAHLHGRAAVGLDALELAAVALHAADRDAAHLRAVERLQHVVHLLRPDDADHELHCALPFFEHGTAPRAGTAMPRGAIVSPRRTAEKLPADDLEGQQPGSGVVPGGVCGDNRGAVAARLQLVAADPASEAMGVRTA